LSTSGRISSQPTWSLPNLQSFDSKDGFGCSDGLFLPKWIKCVWWCDNDCVWKIFETLFSVCQRCLPHCRARHYFSLQ